jgi:F-type H+-transporting ATPase subunit epsilon
MPSLNFELVTPERVVFRQEVDKVTLPTTLGEITVLPGHADLVATLVPGVAVLGKGAVEEDVAVSGGFIQVSEGSRVRVLAETAERGFELDLTAITAAKDRAEKVMQETVRSDDVSFAAAAAALERELARYKVAHKHRETRKIPTIDRASLPPDENPV